MTIGLLLIFIFSITLCLIGAFLFFSIKKRPLASEPPQSQHLVSSLVIDGLNAYWHRILSSIIQVMASLILIFGAFTLLFKKSFLMSLFIGFFMGGSVMVLLSYVSLKLYPKLIPKIIDAHAGYLKDGVLTLFKASSSLGFLMNGIVMIFFSLALLIFDGSVALGFNLGLVFTMLFIRIGGGLYYSNANIANQLSSSLNKDIPENDKRNPGSIMDIIGIYISQMNGFLTDITGSFVFSLTGCLLTVLGLKHLGVVSPLIVDKFYFFPLVICAAGLASSVFSYLFSSYRIKKGKLSNFLLEGLYLSIFLTGCAAYFASATTSPIYTPFLPFLLGLIGSVLICFISEVMTSQKYRFSKPISEKAQFGGIVSFLSGSSLGYLTNGIFLMIILSFISISYLMSGTLGVVLSIFGFVSIAHSIIQKKLYSHYASIISKVSTLGETKKIAKVHLKKSEYIGSTTVALGNGYATAAALLATCSIAFSFVISQNIDVKDMFYLDVDLVVGIMLGLILPFSIIGYLSKSLSKQIVITLKEIERQLKEIPFLKENKANPDIISVSDNTTHLALNALVIPGLIIGIVPMIIGFLMGPDMSAGLIIGMLFTGFNQGLFWAITGDNLHFGKTYIQQGHLGGPGTTTYKNLLQINTIGISYKHLLNPTINTMVKAVAILSICVTYSLM